MENYSYGGAASYPDSGDSSPRSREIDFENPPPWEDQSQPSPNYKVKFMCSYGGNITPRPHDNHLSYVGGETKILSVERNTKFAPFVAKLSALCDADVCFKYQLPGEDLDALISVTNDDDLEHMMHEYDRLFRGMAKPARLRLFLFPVNGRNELERTPSTDPKTDRERFVEALNSGHGSVDGSSPPANILPGNNVDFLFAVEKGVAAAGVPIAAPVALLPQQAEIRRDERVIGSDSGEIQRRIQELQRMQIGHDPKQQAAAVYQQQQQQQRGDVINSNGNNGNMAQAYGGDFYKLPDQKLQPANLQQGYWQESKQMMQTSGGYPATITAASSLEPSLPPPQQQQQPVYMIPAQGNIYQAPIRTQPAPAPAAQGGFYAVPREQNQLQQQLYREQQQSPPPPQQHQLQQQQQMYNVVTHAPAPKIVQAYPPEMMRQNVNVSGGMTDAGGGGYAQVAYDSSGRQVYYTAPGGVMPPPQQAAYHPQQQPGIVVSSDMRTSSGIGQEGKVVITKVP